MALKDANLDLQRVVAHIQIRNNSDYIITYDEICDYTGYDRKTVMRLVAILKKLGYVKVSTGFDDEGLIRGRGFWVVNEKQAEVNVLVDLLAERNQLERKDGIL